MIVTEYYTTRSDGVKLYRTYSDEGKNIRQVETGIEYGEAVDVEGAGFTYEEVEAQENAEEVAGEVTEEVEE